MPLNTQLTEIQAEMDAVAKQIVKVDANSRAVEAAISGQASFRGYSGEDVFLKNNLQAVQKEMMKQLRRREQSLANQKRELLKRATQTTTPLDGEHRQCFQT